MESGMYVTQQEGPIPTEVFIVSAERELVIYSKMIFPVEMVISLIEQGAKPENVYFDLCLN